MEPEGVEDSSGKFVAINEEQSDSILSTKIRLVPVGTMDDVFILNKCKDDEI